MYAPKADAESLQQDLWVKCLKPRTQQKLLRMAARADGPEQVRRYLSVMARNRSVDWVRSSVRRSRITLATDLAGCEGGDRLYEALPVGSEPQDDFDEERLSQSLLKHLPEGERHAMSLKLDGLGNAEIAEALSITPNAVAKRLERARARFLALQPHPES